MHFMNIRLEDDSGMQQPASKSFQVESHEGNCYENTENPPKNTWIVWDKSESILLVNFYKYTMKYELSLK